MRSVRSAINCIVYAMATPGAWHFVPVCWAVCEILIHNKDGNPSMHESASRYDAARKQDLSGVTLGRFHIQNRLGAGGMGEVYRAEDTMLRRVVAIKRLSS